MRKFIRDVLFRSVEIIEERERKTRESEIDDRGRPSACMFCKDRPSVVIVSNGKQAFLCAEHIGPFVVDWTTEHELTLVRL
jgi:hypothetical protein